MRGRIIPCKGCPTEECTCMSSVEEALLERLNETLGSYKTYKADTTNAIEGMLMDMKKIRTALEFYAEQAHKQTGIFAWGAQWDKDLGAIAREALK